MGKLSKYYSAYQKLNAEVPIGPNEEDDDYEETEVSFYFDLPLIFLLY